MTAKAPKSISDAAAIDAYVGKTPEPFRGALEHIRTLVKAAAPDAEEALVYGVPGFRLNGRPLVCYAAFKAHCGFYPMNPALMDSLKDELAGYRTAKGTIQFTPDKPLPDALLRKIVTARVTENGAGKQPIRPQ